MANRWVAFARTGDPNYVGGKAESRRLNSCYCHDRIFLEVVKFLNLSFRYFEDQHQ